MKLFLGNVPYYVTADELDDYLLRLGCYSHTPPNMHVDAKGERTGTACIDTEMALDELRRRLALGNALQGLRLRADLHTPRQRAA